MHSSWEAARHIWVRFYNLFCFQTDVKTISVFVKLNKITCCNRLVTYKNCFWEILNQKVRPEKTNASPIKRMNGRRIIYVLGVKVLILFFFYS